MTHSFRGRAALGGERGKRRADLRIAATAIFGEIDKEFGHRLELHGVDDRTAFTPRAHQPGVREQKKLCRERIRGKTELSRDIPCSHAVRPCLYEKTKDIEAGVLGERCKALDSIVFIHI